MDPTSVLIGILIAVGVYALVASIFEVYKMVMRKRKRRK